MPYTLKIYGSNMGVDSNSSSLVTAGLVTALSDLISQDITIIRVNDYAVQEGEITNGVGGVKIGRYSQYQNYNIELHPYEFLVTADVAEYKNLSRVMNMNYQFLENIDFPTNWDLHPAGFYIDVEKNSGADTQENDNGYFSVSIPFTKRKPNAKS